MKYAAWLQFLSSFTSESIGDLELAAMMDQMDEMDDIIDEEDEDD